MRQHDLCARFGGDEFIVVLWDCRPENEARRVSDLQCAVAAHPFEPRPGVRVSLSISAGAARFPEDGNTFEELLAAGGRYRQLYDKQYSFEKDRFINPGEDFTPEPESLVAPAARSNNAL